MQALIQAFAALVLWSLLALLFLMLIVGLIKAPILTLSLALGSTAVFALKSVNKGG